jgi:hypothetical protein
MLTASRTASKLVLSLASLVFLSAPALAQRAMGSASTKLIRVVVSGGLTLPAGELKTFHDATGVHADASLLLRIPGLGLTVRPELSITRLKQNATKVINYIPPINGDPIPQTGGTTQMLGALGNIELPLVGGLYVLGGAGVLNLDSEKTSESKLTVNAGAGLRFNMGRVDGFLEARFGTASYSSGTFGYSKTSFIPITFGLTF